MKLWKFTIYNLDLGPKYTILNDKQTKNVNHGTQMMKSITLQYYKMWV
jgi:hypothetical protein